LFPKKKNILEKADTHLFRALERQSNEESSFYPLKGFN